MAKQRRRSTNPAPAPANRDRPGEPRIDLLHCTGLGFDALRARLHERAGAGNKADQKEHALDAALRRLQADYERVLTRRRSSQAR